MHLGKAQDGPNYSGESAKGPGERGQVKASRYDYNQEKNQGIISNFPRCFAKGLKSKSRWRLLEICLVFKLEMMAKENSIALEKKEDMKIKKANAEEKGGSRQVCRLH